ncbi:MAG: hypothetical protein IPJ14_20490 [Kineosporiaceae bacterium]|nr:hypothetical protein [Kineosporiaceae bacterium]MBK7624969.1 hypothetical protein [Kineosporiaceae bacterium]MBK8076651.1 hypothetical protein [Kineosporiaceae bacterium]
MVRVGRTVAIAVIGCVLSATAHSLVSGLTLAALLGDAPRSSWGLLVLISVAGVLPLGSRRQPWWVIASALTAMQLAQHVVLLTTEPTLHRSATMTPTGPHVVRMVLGHAAAAAVTAVIAGRGERAFALLRRWLGWFAVRWAPATATPTAVPVSCPRVLLLAAGLVQGGPGLRGPPVLGRVHA